MPDFTKEAQHLVGLHGAMSYEEMETSISAAIASAYERGKEDERAEYKKLIDALTPELRLEGARLCARAAQEKGFERPITDMKEYKLASEAMEWVCKATRSVVTDLEKGKAVERPCVVKDCDGQSEYGHFACPEHSDCCKPVVEGVCDFCGMTLCKFDDGCSDVFKFCNKNPRQCHGEKDPTCLSRWKTQCSVCGKEKCDCDDDRCLNTPKGNNGELCHGHSEPPRCERCDGSGIDKTKDPMKPGSMLCSACQPTKGEV